MRNRSNAVADRAKRPKKSGKKSTAEPLDVSAEYWRKVVPGLHVADAEFLAGATPLVLSAEMVDRCRTQLQADGFFTLPPDALPWASSLQAMRIGVRRLIKRGWPASMLLIYDEAWAMAHQISSLMAAVSGGCANSLDTLAWSVTPCLGQSGFAPHRDRQPADVPGSFRADGTPKYCTCWVALSAATTDNSCLYLVPRGHDPGYDEGDDHSPDAEDPLLRVFRSSDAAVQSVRACPLKPGGVVIFTHRAMHWGSKGQDGCADARISISYGFTDPGFEAPYFRSVEQALPFPPVPLRAALASAQLINYHERFDFGLPLLRRFGATFNAHRPKFTQEYAEKTAAEYLAACNDLMQRAAAGKSDAQSDAQSDGSPGASLSSANGQQQEQQEQPQKKKRKKSKAGAAAFPGMHAGHGWEEEEEEEDEADAALDDALDAMLDAQAAADGNLFDDFDADEAVAASDSD